MKPLDERALRERVIPRNEYGQIKSREVILLTGTHRRRERRLQRFVGASGLDEELQPSRIAGLVEHLYQIVHTVIRIVDIPNHPAVRLDKRFERKPGFRL
jgi:hypothetical protein